MVWFGGCFLKTALKIPFSSVSGEECLAFSQLQPSSLSVRSAGRDRCWTAAFCCPLPLWTRWQVLDFDLFVLFVAPSVLMKSHNILAHQISADEGCSACIFMSFSGAKR